MRRRHEIGTPVPSPLRTDTPGLIVEVGGWEAFAQPIMTLRDAVAPALGRSDDGDLAAMHILARHPHDRSLVGAARLTSAARVHLDFESILASPIPDGCRPEIVSLSRLVVASRPAAQLKPIIAGVVRAACRSAWEDGARAALICAPEPLAALYQRLIGVKPITPILRHPRTGRPVRLMHVVPDPAGSGLLDCAIADRPGRPATPELLDWIRRLEGNA